MRTPTIRALATLALGASLLPAGLAAQNPPAATPVPCRDGTCRLVFDWGSGRTASSFPPDRRYGSGDDFEARVRSTLLAAGFRMTDDQRPGEVTITLRPVVRKAMCDQMPGTNTDMSCQTATDLALSFMGGEGVMKLPNSRSFRNSCGDVMVLMSMPQFGSYAGQMIVHSIEGEKRGDRRPAMKC